MDTSRNDPFASWHASLSYGRTTAGRCAAMERHVGNWESWSCPSYVVHLRVALYSSWAGTMRVRIPQLGRIVRQFRLERDIGQKEVSAKVRYSTRSLRRLEKEGERPERVMLIRILVDGLRIRD